LAAETQEWAQQQCIAQRNEASKYFTPRIYNALTLLVFFPLAMPITNKMANAKKEQNL
jgi:hypothetical protein